MIYGTAIGEPAANYLNAAGIRVRLHLMERAAYYAEYGDKKLRGVLYTGSAGEAALLYPQNANVAAAVALAGLGFEATQVELVADPGAAGNIHEIEAEGAAGRFAIALQGKPSRTNPKTSALAALSVARALLNEQARIVI